MEKKPLISVIIPSYNSEPFIERCLLSLSSQTIPRQNYEIIVVDDGSQDDSVKIARKYADKVISSTHHSAGKARNTGAKCAGADQIAFIDSDCEVESNWIERYVEELKENGAVCGSLVNGNSNLVSWAEYLMEFSDFGDKTKRRQVKFAAGANQAYRKDIFLQVGGFPETPKVSEDYMLGAKLKDGGYKMMFVPDIKVYHYGNTTKAGFHSKMMSFGRRTYYDSLKFPSRYTKFTKNKTSIFLVFLQKLAARLIRAYNAKKLGLFISSLPFIVLADYHFCKGFLEGFRKEGFGKNVLIVSQYFPPESVGRASRIFELASFLKQYHNVTVLCPPPTYPFAKFQRHDYIRRENADGIEVVRMWTYNPPERDVTFFQRAMYMLSFSLLASLFVLKNHKKFSTVIASSPPSSVLFTTIPARLFRKKIILDIGDFAFEMATYYSKRKKRAFFRKMLEKFEHSCYEHADIITVNRLAVTEEIEKLIALKKKNNHPKIEYFPYRIDTSIFKSINGNRSRTIIYIGNFGPAQNLSALIKSMSFVSSKLPDVHLELYGGGDRETEIKNLATGLGLDEICNFKEPVPRSRVPEILSKAMLGIVPLAMDDSLKFAVPSKTFEYMACGLPVFSYGPSKELEKILHESSGGIMVRSDDPQVIGEEIVKMINDKEALDKLSKSGKSFVNNLNRNENLAALV